MLSFIIILTLVFSFFIGQRRGFILQLVHLIGYFVAIYVAYSYFSEFAAFIRLWIPYPQFSTDSPVGMIFQTFEAESVYYSGIAFAMLFFGTKIILHIVGSMLDFLAHLPFLRTVNQLLGGILCFVEAYLIIFVVLLAGALLPIDFIQEHLQRSIVADFIMHNTPFLSEWVRTLWEENVL